MYIRANVCIYFIGTFILIPLVPMVMAIIPIVYSIFLPWDCLRYKFEDVERVCATALLIPICLALSLIVSCFFVTIGTAIVWFYLFGYILKVIVRIILL